MSKPTIKHDSVQCNAVFHFASENLRVLGLLAVVLICCGCASVKVYRVPSLAECDSSPAALKKAQELEGFRYYLSRPYVAVKKPFPLFGTDYYVHGRIIGSLGMVAVSDVDVKALPIDLQKHFRGNSIPGDQVYAPETPKPRVKIRGDAQHAGDGDSESGKSDDGKSKDTKDDKSDESGKGTPAKDGATGGGGGSSNPVLTLNDLYDVVMLPDFDEQYAIQLHGGAGQTTSNLAFKDGWMLESTGVTVDNTAITKGVFDTIGKLIDLGTGVANPAAAAAKSASNLTNAATGTAQHGGTLDGTIVLLRVRKFCEVQPGLYPVLKRSEVTKRPLLAKSSPAAPAIDSTIGTSVPATNLALPNYPFTVVPFNISETVTIELVSSLPIGNAGNPPDEEAANAPKPLTETDARKTIAWLGTVDLKSPLPTKNALDYLGGNAKIDVKRIVVTAAGILTIYLSPDASIPPDSEKAVLETQLSAAITNPAPAWVSKLPKIPTSVAIVGGQQ